MRTLGNLLLTILTFLTPIKFLVLMVVGFILLDTILGVYSTIKLNGRKSYKSSRFFNIVIKTFFYTSTILLFFLVDNFILGGSLWGIPYLLSKSISVLWIYAETKSMDETSIKLGNRPIFDIIKEMVFRFKDLKKDLNE